MSTEMICEACEAEALAEVTTTKHFGGKLVLCTECCVFLSTSKTDVQILPGATIPENCPVCGERLTRANGLVVCSNGCIKWKLPKEGV